jgi:hypothetical protein
MTLTEECKPTTTADVYSKQAQVCRKLATQTRREDRTCWLGLSDGWFNTAQDDEQGH